MMYIEDLYKSIWKKLKLFKVKDINKASMKVMGIKKKNRLRESKKGDKFKKSGRNPNYKVEQSQKYQYDSKNLL